MKYLALLVALLISACSSVIPYEPVADMTREEARKILMQTFEEQPEKYRPVTIDIGDDAIRLGVWATKFDGWTGVSTPVEGRQAYYFSNIADLQLILRRGRYRINLSNRQGSVKRWVWFYSEKQGTDFLDAMSRMTRPN